MSVDTICSFSNIPDHWTQTDMQTVMIKQVQGTSWFKQQSIDLSNLKPAVMINSKIFADQSPLKWSITKAQSIL